MNNKYIVIGIGLALILGGLGIFLPRVDLISGLAGTSSPVGTTNTTAKFYSIEMAPSTSAASSSSILNTDGTDRVIESTVADCNTVGTSQTYLTGAGLTSTGWNLKAATTSTAAQTGSTNYASNITIATTTPDVFSATSTEGVITGTARIWPTGSYLTFTFNATNTAACVVGAHTISS